MGKNDINKRSKLLTYRFASPICQDSTVVDFAGAARQIQSTPIPHTADAWENGRSRVAVIYKRLFQLLTMVLCQYCIDGLKFQSFSEIRKQLLMSPTGKGSLKDMLGRFC